MRTMSLLTGIAICLLAGVFLCADTQAGTEAQGWPNWRGAGCNGSASETGIDYVDSLKDAKLLWTSEALVFATYVGTCTGKSGNLVSGVSSPIAADGKVFLYYYKAADEPVLLNTYAKPGQAPAHERMAKAYDGDTFYKPLMTREEYVHFRCNLYAYDRIICMDADTGKTLWDTALPGLMGGGGRSNAKWEPAYADGMLAAATDGGRLCGIDAETGKIVWTWTDDAFVQELDQTAKKNGSPARLGFTANLMIADGVVLYTAGDKRPLRGFDLKTGELLWDMVDVGTAAGQAKPQALGNNIPLRWTHQGKEYGTAGGTCFEPRTGKVLWHVNGRPCRKTTRQL